MCNVDDIRNAVAKVIVENGDEGRIAASWVAHRVMTMLDPSRQSVPSVYWGCNEHVKQEAGLQLRGRYRSNEIEDGQHDLFPELQKRYPQARKRGEEPCYVKLELMSEEDKDYNVARLRSEADTKQRHADALEDWWKRHRVRGAA